MKKLLPFKPFCIGFFITLMLIIICLIGCYNWNDSDSMLQQQTETLLKEATNQIGLPNIVNFQQKKLMKMIYELTDREDLVCYAYMYSDYQGKLIYVGKCVGYGLPFSAQYSNPEKLVNLDMDDYPETTLPQAEPNGLFMPTSSSATWLIMIDPETNEPRPVYFEPTIVVSPFKLQ